MKSTSLNHPPSWHQQVTACVAVALVLMLTVLTASQQLHDWMHGHGSAPAPAHGSAPGDNLQNSDHDDAGCVVTLFASGVVLAALGIVALSGLWQFVNLLSRVEMAACRQTPRYWLPPLCGPPLS